MRYRFRRDEVQPTPSNPTGILYRPKIPVWIGSGIGPRRPFIGLLDTGADDTKLPMGVAERLGVILDRDRPILFRGVGGESFGLFGEVTMELRQSPKSYVWTARVAFLRDPPEVAADVQANVVLGHTGFFRYFHAGFDFQRGRVQLRPNGLFPGVRG